MRVVLNIADPDWARLATTADRHGIKVETLIRHAVVGLLGDETARQAKARARRDRIVELARQGLTDQVIVERTGETRQYVAHTRQYVAHTRRGAGIKANMQARSGKTERTTP